LNDALLAGIFTATGKLVKKNLRKLSSAPAKGFHSMYRTTLFISKKMAEAGKDGG